jgi:hypothetical protein
MLLCNISTGENLVTILTIEYFFLEHNYLLSKNTIRLNYKIKTKKVYNWDLTRLQ